MTGIIMTNMDNQNNGTIAITFIPTRVNGKNHVKPVNEDVAYEGNTRDLKKLAKILGKRKRMLIRDEYKKYWYFGFL